MKKVFVYFHTHWDREWYKTRVEFNFRLVKVVDDILKKLSSKELPYFYFDGQVSAIEDYLKIRPENKQLIADLIKQNKFAIGPFYCSTDSFLVSVQSLLSNIDMGLEYSKEFGGKEFIGYCADTFGHSKSLPEIFKYYGFKGGIFWRGLGELPCCFDWAGLKSVYLRQGYFHDYLNSSLNFKEKADFIENQLKKVDDGSEILLLPLGADHLKVADNVKVQIAEINKYLKDYELVISNPFEYFDKIKTSAKKEGELYDNSRNFLLSGIFSSRIDIKQQNSYLQWKMFRLAEPLNALCYNKKLIQENYQPQINQAKKELIKNHAHDSIYGCSTDSVHKDMQRRFDIAEQTSNCVIENILNEIEDTKSKEISVINLSDYEYSGLCKIQTDKKLKNAQLIGKNFYVSRDLSLDINRIPITEDFKPIYTYLIEANGIKPFSAAKIDLKMTPSDLKITKNSVENSKIRLSVKNDKIEIEDKKTGKIYKNFVEIIDNADAGDSYNFAPIKNDKDIKAEITGSKIAVKGDFRSELEITFKINIPYKSDEKRRTKKNILHKMKLLATLDKNSDFIKFKILWENKSQNHILKVVFNYENPVTKTVSDDMLGTVERTFAPTYKPADFVPAKRGIELKSNSRCMQTFVSTQGVGIITKGLNEYTPYKNTIGLTILRSTGIISNPQNPSRGTPAGPPIETPDLQMLKNLEAEFAIIFSDKETEIKKAQQSFYGSTFAFFGNINENLLNIKNEFISAKYDKKLDIRTYNKEKDKLCDL